jgi:hypothetical protein|tara:strand:- start:746 stop:967 length:222 start_codon:yes stop_codon:yes gene_type:complete
MEEYPLSEAYSSRELSLLNKKILMKRKNCTECNQPIVNIKGKAPRTRYCSPECAESAMKKYQAGYRKRYSTLY